MPLISALIAVPLYESSLYVVYLVYKVLLTAQTPLSMAVWVKSSSTIFPPDKRTTTPYYLVVLRQKV